MSAGSDIRARITAGLERAQVRTGGDDPLAATVIKPGTLDESTYPPVQRPGRRLPCTAFIGNYSVRDAATTLVSLTDAALMLVGDGLQLTNDDKLELRVGSKVMIMELSNAAPFMPTGEVLYYRATGSIVKA